MQSKSVNSVCKLFELPGVSQLPRVIAPQVQIPGAATNVLHVHCIYEVHYSDQFSLIFTHTIGFYF